MVVAGGGLPVKSGLRHVKLLNWRAGCWCPACCQAAMAAGAEPPSPAPRVSEFAWLGTVAGVECGSLVRIALPADALTRLQSRAGHDVRVLNAAGDVIPMR